MLRLYESDREKRSKKSSTVSRGKRKRTIREQCSAWCQQQNRAKKQPMKDERAPTATLLGEEPTRSIFIWCYAKTPSVNEWSNKKHHLWLYASKRKEWMLRLKIALRFIKDIKFDCVEIGVKRYSVRMLDQANAADGLKPIIDCLTERNKGLGLFKDDSIRYMPHAPRIQQVKVNKEAAEKSIIVIKEIE